MAILSQILKLDRKTTSTILLIGKPEETSHVSSEGEPYVLMQLLEAVTCRCSSDKRVASFETTEVLLRESELESPEWKFIDEKKSNKGFWRDNADKGKPWVVDFSKSHEMPIYQEDYISAWTRGNRIAKGAAKTAEINKGIQARIDAAKAAADQRKNGKAED